ncbi:pyridoxal phosphate-dependent aminotransferase [Rarobacter incanus]|nr:aminotransferase class I/II-fold pyridoxal phosphate-dependent enzyme [Rarobacter incanus]
MKKPQRRKISDLSAMAPRSGIRDVFDKCDDYDSVISFAVGEPGFTAPAHVAAAGCGAIEAGRTHYTNVLGIDEFRLAVSDYSRKVKGLRYDPATEIQAVPGATLGLYLALRATVDPGDEVILCSPHFTSYDAQILLCGATPVYVPLRAENGMRMDANDIAAAITDRTRAIIVNSPSNPTGAVTPLTELARIAELCVRHDMWVISDEVYHPFVYGAEYAAERGTGPSGAQAPAAARYGAGRPVGEGVSAPSIALCDGMKDRAIVVDSLSKTYAMTGWRIGYMLAPRHVIAETSKLAELINSSNNAPAQYAAVAALTGVQKEVGAMRGAYDARRRLVMEALADCPGLTCVAPQGAFYAFVDVTGTGLTSQRFADLLLEEERVAVIPGEAFGAAGAGFVRISYAGDDQEIREGMRRIVEFSRRHAMVAYA